MIVRTSLVLALALGAWACAGEEEAPQEPVAMAPAGAESIPDAPGDAGEGAAQPAGEGQAAEPGSATAEPGSATAEPVVAPEASAPNPAAAVGGSWKVHAGTLNVRSAPGTANPVVRTLKRGEVVAVQGCEKGWCQLAAGEFIAKKYLRPAS